MSKDNKEKIWSTVRVVVSSIIAIGSLAMMATNFDSTEIAALIPIIATSIVTEIRRYNKEHEDND